MIVALGVSHAYGQRVVLDRIDFELQGGESVAVQGPSGVGKTTLLAILGGLVKPQAGQVTRTEQAAWVLQTNNALPRRTVLDNVALGLLADGVGRRQAEAHAISALSAVGLEDLLNEPARRLSGGELQRVSLARALAMTRALVIADEPTGQLDRSTAELVTDALVAGMSNGRAALIATHDPVVAARCSRVVHLSDGRLTESGR